MNFASSLRVPSDIVLAYARARSAMYAVERLVVPVVEVLTGRRPSLRRDPALFAAIRRSLDELLQADVARIERGIYPIEVLRPGSAWRHVRRMPELLREGVALSRRKGRRDAHDFGAEAREYLGGVPEYYRRNFHWQSDGYLSDKSARLYEHQVELLFAGGGDAMRRLIIEPMKRAFGGSDGEGLTFLEVGAGTGRGTRFVRLAFPRARIVALDLSAPYMKRARTELAEFGRLDFVEGAGEALPFRDGLFDAVYSVFLFHELPLATRSEVLRESMRALKPGGFLGWADSLQLGDRPELDEALGNFPSEFHEPFYKNYIEHPMEALAEAAGLEGVESEVGFLAKRVSGRKPVAK